jgi:hypothetical protein
VYSIQHYLIKFVSDLVQVGGFLRVLRFPLPIKLTARIYLNPENCENRNDPDLVQAFLKKWWVETGFKAPNLPLSLRLNDSGCHYNSIYNNTETK